MMYEQARKLNERIKEANFTEEQLNILVRFGQVAKFRCRSNTAFKNFVTACFEEVAKLEDVEIPDGRGGTFTGIKAVK